MTREVEELYSELFATAGLGRRVGERIAALEGQTQSRWQTLWTIEAGGSLTVPQIARRLGVSRQNEQRVVNDLVDDGLVEVVANPDHKTSPLATLTAAGERVLARINRAATASNQAILERMTPREVTRLRASLAAFRDAARLELPDD